MFKINLTININFSYILIFYRTVADRKYKNSKNSFSVVLLTLSFREST